MTVQTTAISYRSRSWKKIGLGCALMLVPSWGWCGDWQQEQTAILDAQVTEDHCGDAGRFQKLFALSVFGRYTGAAALETLSEVNEDAFLNCPKPFLMALQNQGEATRKAVLNNFGIVHPPWDLGAELRHWTQDPEVGAFVKTHFSGFLSAKEP